MCCGFYVPSSNTENALETKISLGQKPNASQERYLQYSFTFSHLELHRENATASDSATFQHTLNPNKEGEAAANRLFLISFHF